MGGLEENTLLARDDGAFDGRFAGPQVMYSASLQVLCLRLSVDEPGVAAGMVSSHSSPLALSQRHA